MNLEDIAANVSVGSIKNLLMKVSVVFGTWATPTSLHTSDMICAISPMLIEQQDRSQQVIVNLPRVTRSSSGKLTIRHVKQLVAVWRKCQSFFNSGDDKYIRLKPALGKRARADVEQELADVQHHLHNLTQIVIGHCEEKDADCHWPL